MPDVKRRSMCPITSTLDIIGDKWTLIVVRDLLMGIKRYSDFLETGESITTSILANRLKRLEVEKIICKKPYQNNPIRYEYELTKKGKDLTPVFDQIINWATNYRSEVIEGKL